MRENQIHPDLCWNIPEPREKLMFYDRIVTKIASGDQRDRLENYLGRFEPEQRLKIYAQIAKGGKVSAEFEYVIEGLDREELRRRARHLIYVNTQGYYSLSLSNRIRVRIRRFVEEIFDEPKEHIVTYYDKV